MIDYQSLMYIVYSLDEKPASAENTVPKSETSSGESQTEQSRLSPIPGTEFPANPFDFSAMTGLLNVCSFITFLSLCHSAYSFSQILV